MLRNTISLTMIDSGYKTNIIPENATATLDIRLLPNTDPNEFLSTLVSLVDDERVQFIPKRTPENNFTSNWDTDLFHILSEELNNQKPDALVLPFMTIGGTDSQFFQSKGVDCYGIIPVLVTEDDIQTMHGIDERISIENFMLGNKVVYNTIKRVCSKK
jgi:acetylornithine deacetylase/succinyl-diaminopimelate desuccinylase-like protein